ncbi:MAG TPA: acyl-ACP thioesterase domain-containing protein [Acidimicrobiales bacterium]|nr:acyl-ACP thioesterase domain-containing protein [Acidimicrobiales bacterium]
MAPPSELAAAFVDFPGRGRRFSAPGRIGFADTGPDRRLRLDALARMVQDAGTEDLTDAGFDPASPWVLRRAAVWVPGPWPTLGEAVTVTTFCAGLCARWGERRTTVASPSARVEISAVWIFLDEQGRPARLGQAFLDVYGPSAGGRTTSSRLGHPGPPPDADGEAWPLRRSDLDAFGHVNNAALWIPAEEALAAEALVPQVAELEFRAPVAAGDAVSLARRRHGDELWVWIRSGGQVRASARLTGAPSER